MTPTTAVSIEIVTKEEYIQTIGGGGMKITIDGNRLLRHVNGREPRNADWHPEYMGVCIASDMWQLIGTTATVLEEEPIYEVHSVDFMEYVLAVILEPLGEDALRVAYRGNKPSEQAGAPVQAAPRSACGYPVDMDAWGAAVLDAGQTLRDELVELGYETPGDEEGFDPLLEELRAQLPDD